MNRFEPTLHIKQGYFELQFDDRLPGDCGFNSPRWTIRASFSRRDAAAIEGAARAQSKIRLTWSHMAGDAIINEWSVRQGSYRKAYFPDQSFTYLEVVFKGIGPILAAEESK